VFEKLAIWTMPAMTVTLYYHRNKSRIEEICIENPSPQDLSKLLIFQSFEILPLLLLLLFIQHIYIF